MLRSMNDPWAQTGRATAESRKRQVTMRGERTWDGVMLTKGPVTCGATGLKSLGPRLAPFWLYTGVRN